MSDLFFNEDRKLKKCWDQYSYEHLDSYLVQGVEDPRINCQSILTRGLIADCLWPGEFGDLINAELQFGAVMTWLLKELKDGVSRQELFEAITSENQENVPQFVLRACNEGLSEDCIVPDYVTDSLDGISNGQSGDDLKELSLNTFIHLWELATRGRKCKPAGIIEAACGSANDFRFISKYGLAKHIRYSGFDISSKNISNARNRFADVDFFIASIMDSGVADGAYDYMLVHDLFEHLSIKAMEKALEEVVRIVRKEAWLHFFNADRIDDHQVNRTSGYHWNNLSVSKICQSLEKMDASVEVINIAEMLEGKFACQNYHNQQAVTMIVRKN